MKTRMLMTALIFFATGTAFADVTNEVLVGFENDWATKVTDAADNDITDSREIYNSLLILQYSHFFASLKDDEKPIELHRFYQHPSSISIGLTQKARFVRDSTTPSLFGRRSTSNPCLRLAVSTISLLAPACS